MQLSRTEKKRGPGATKRVLVNPENIDWVTPGRRDYAVRFEHPTLWGHYLVPVTILVGPKAEEGRGVVAIGSTHGNEYEGPVAIKHLLRQIQLKDVIGRIVLIPVLNVVAFHAGTRDSPDDGINLNRAFPGNANGSITFRIADFVTRFVLPQIHVVLDIHAGGLVGRFTHCTSFHHVSNVQRRKLTEQTAREFGAPVSMLYQDKTPGLLCSTAEQLGKIVVGSELGWGQSINTQGVGMALRGILAAAIRQGQLRGELPPAICPAKQQKLLDTTASESSVLAPCEGYFEPVTCCGELVRAGQRLAYLHDFNHLDDPPIEVATPHDGYVVFQAWEARVFRGQVIALLGRPLAWT